MPYLPYDLGAVVVLQGEDGEVELLVGQPIPRRVPHCHVTVSQGGVVALRVHTWGRDGKEDGHQQ